MRLFVAVAVSDEVKDLLVEAQRLLATHMERADIRWQNPERSHLTLKFLGEVSERDLPGCRLALSEAARRSGPFNLTTAGFGAFPTPARPSVLWLGVGGETDGLHRLQGLVAAGLEHLAAGGQGERFNPHLTLGRVRRLDSESRAAFAGLLSAEALEPVAWRVGAVDLVSSRLGPGGARHEVLLSAPLSGQTRG